MYENQLLSMFIVMLHFNNHSECLFLCFPYRDVVSTNTSNDSDKTIVDVSKLFVNLYIDDVCLKCIVDITCPSPLWVQIPPGIFDSFM